MIVASKTFTTQETMANARSARDWLLRSDRIEPDVLAESARRLLRGEGLQGQILVGMQVPPAEMGEFKKFLKNLGYPHWNETGNPAYKLFLD